MNCTKPLLLHTNYIGDKDFYNKNGEKIYWNKSIIYNPNKPDYDERTEQEIYNDFLTKKKANKYKLNETRYHMIPCGKCNACLKAKAMDWCTRLTIERYHYLIDNKYYIERRYNYFYMVLLTYDNENLKYDKNNQPTLCKSDIQNFFKRLRITLERKYKTKITLSYFIAGEYGQKGTIRPHYHTIIMSNLPIDYNSKYYITKRGNKVFKSWFLEKKIWKMGFCNITPIDMENEKAFLYCGNYACKLKPNIKKEIKPFVIGSKRPAIGKYFYQKNKKQIFDTRNFNGLFEWKSKKRKIPVYFYNLLKREDREKYEEIKKLMYIESLKDNKEPFNIKANENKILKYSSKIQTWDEAEQDEWYNDFEYDYEKTTHEKFNLNE